MVQTLTAAMMRNCRDFFYPEDMFVGGEYQSEKDYEGMLYGVELNGEMLRAAPEITIAQINRRVRMIEQRFCMATYVWRYMYKRGFSIPASKGCAGVGPLTKDSPIEDFAAVLAHLLNKRAGYRSQKAADTARAFLTRAGEKTLTREDVLRLAFALSFTPGDLVIFLADYHPDARALNWRSEKELACAYALNCADMHDGQKPDAAYRHYQQIADALARQKAEFAGKPAHDRSSAWEEIDAVFEMISSETDETLLVRHASAMMRFAHLPRLEYRLFDQLLSRLNTLISAELHSREGFDQIIERLQDRRHDVYQDGVTASPELHFLPAELRRVRNDLASLDPETAFAERMSRSGKKKKIDDESGPLLAHMDAADYEHYFYMGSPVSTGHEKNLHTLLETGSCLSPGLLGFRLTRQRISDSIKRSRLPRKQDLQTLAFIAASMEGTGMKTSPDEFGLAPTVDFRKEAGANLELTRTAINLMLHELLGHIRPTTGYEYFLLLCSASRELPLETFRTVYAASFFCDTSETL